MKSVFFFCSLLMIIVANASAQSSSRTDSLRGSINEWRKYDVKYYNLNLAIDTDKKYIKGYNKITLWAVEDQSKIQIDLFENMKITQITLDDKAVRYDRLKSATFVNANIVKGQKYTLTIYYEGNPTTAVNAPWDGGFVWQKDIENRPWVGVACEGTGASLWWPNKDHLSDEPDSMEMHFTTDVGLQVISNGNLTSVTEGKKNQKTFNWKVSYPINNYNVTVYIGDYAHFSDLYTAMDSSKLQCDYYVLSNHKSVAQSHFLQVHKVLRAYEYYFGKYPFWRDGYALVESPYLGMEHQSAIAYGNQYKRGYLGAVVPNEFDFDYIILHETAHEYFGNSVSCTDLGDMWIHESFATYMEALYVEYYHGIPAATRYLVNQAKFIKNESPIFGPYGVNAEPSSSDQYYKGSWMLHSLRNTIDDDGLWFSIIKEFYQKHKIASANRDDFINLVNAKTKKDYTAFINQYMRWAEPPLLEYKIDQRNGLSIINYRWNCIEKTFDMPVEFDLDGFIIKMEPSKEWKSIEFHRNFTSIKPSMDKRYFKATLLEK